MIEAVNSVISNAQLVRGNADQVATSGSFAADSQAVESVARGPVAPYISPYISVDPRFDTAVLQIRDSDTGDVLKQFPSESTLKLRIAQEARQQPLQSQADSAREATPQQSAATFETVSIAQQAPVQPQVGVTSSAGAAQAAIAALSAGAQSGQSGVGQVNVTA